MTDFLSERLVAEYLQWRGILDTDALLKSAPDARVIKSDRLVGELLEYVDVMDYARLRRKWSALNKHLFNSVTKEQSKLATDFEADLFKLLLVRCIVKNDNKRCVSFFNDMGVALRKDPGWTEWFYLPYVVEPREIDTYRKYFTKQWREVFALSLHNFFNLVLGGRSQPLLSHLTETASAEAALEREPTSPLHTPTSSASDAESEVSRGGLGMRVLTDISPAMGSIDDELLDEFAVIAQCTGSLRATSKPSLKALIKNISSKRVNDERHRSGGN